MTYVVVEYMMGYIVMGYRLRVPFDYSLHIMFILSSGKVLVRKIITKLERGSCGQSDAHHDSVVAP